MSVEFNPNGTVKVTDEVKTLATEGHLKVADITFKMKASDGNKYEIPYVSVEALTGRGSAFLCGDKMEVSDDERDSRGKRGRAKEGEEIQKSVLGHFWNSYEGEIRAKLKAQKNKEVEGPEKAIEKAAKALQAQFPNLSLDKVKEMISGQFLPTA